MGTTKRYGVVGYNVVRKVADFLEVKMGWGLGPNVRGFIVVSAVFVGFFRGL